MSDASDDRLNAVRDAQRRGDALAAFDLAEGGLRNDAGRWIELREAHEVTLAYEALLALARSGAPDRALALYDEWKLVEVQDDEDVQALPARLLKDVFRDARGTKRHRLAAKSAAAYEAVFYKTGGYFPGINAATMWLMAGDEARSESVAREVLARLGDDDPADPDLYYLLATRAEAALLTGDLKAAEQAIRAASEVPEAGPGHFNTTWRQLCEVCRKKQIRTDLLERLAPATVAYFSGHLIDRPGSDSRFPESYEAKVRSEVEAMIRTERVGVGFGALACGGDIVCAEALLASGGELHLVFPFNQEEFVELSVAVAGPEWVARFEKCLERATSVTFATDEGHLGDDVLITFGNRVAMGMAVLRARQSGASIVQLALWDGHVDGFAGGTSENLRYWRDLGLTNHVIPTADGVQEPLSTSAADQARNVTGRRLQALLFADVKGFSKLSEDRLPAYWSTVMHGFARVLDEFPQLVYRNTWGDALYLVLDDAPAAARCALALQDFMTNTDFDAAGLPTDFSMRLGGHYGPVYLEEDPVVGRPNYYGNQVSRTARIEPITPPGEVYVTEPFAALLAIEASAAFTCDYVGQVPSAKDYGVFRMYRLRHRSG